MSWEQLQAIQDTNEVDRRMESNEPPVACPIDGEILRVNSRGERSCPLGNYRWLG